MEWGIRILLAAGAGLLGYGAVTHAMAASLATLDPERAHSLAPDDGRVTAILSEKSFDTDTGTPTPQQQAYSASLARQALLREPTAVEAATTLGLVAALRNDSSASRQWLAYAQALSRRNFRTQLWAIEDAVSRDDIPGALRGYDIALRTSSRAPDILYPILASAIADPTIRANLVRTFATKPDWGASFLNYAAFNGKDLSATTALLLALRRAGFPVGDQASAAVVNRLISGNNLDDAWNYYASIHPGVSRNQSRDPGFNAGTDSPSLFDWNPVSAAGVTSGIQKENGVGSFYFSAPSSVGGTALQQVQMLSPGNYAIRGRSSGLDQPPDSRPYWLVKCADDREIGRLYLPNSSENHGMFSGSFRVPEDCPNQVLLFMLRSSDAISGVSGNIDRMILSLAGTQEK